MEVTKARARQILNVQRRMSAVQHKTLEDDNLQLRAEIFAAFPDIKADAMSDSLDFWIKNFYAPEKVSNTLGVVPVLAIKNFGVYAAKPKLLQFYQQVDALIAATTVDDALKKQWGSWATSNIDADIVPEEFKPKLSTRRGTV